MEIYKEKALIINTKKPDIILDNVVKSKLVKTYDNGVSKIIVNWGLDEVLKLSSLRLKNLLTPINKEYNWPGIHKPFDHQKTTAEFLSAYKRAYCLSEAGTGKTSAVIWAADYLMNKKKINRMLVVSPLSIMQAAWQSDFFKTAMHRTVALAHGTPTKRKKVLAENTDVVIINYDGIEIVEKEIAEGGFDLIVVDEANYIKTVTTRRWKAFGLAKLVNPSLMPKYYGTFKDMVLQKVSQFTWIPRAKAQDIVFKTLQPAIRYTKEECLDLPDVTYQVRDVPLTPQQDKYYKKLKKEMFIQAAGEEITVVNAAVMLTKLLQVSAGSVYADNKKIIEFDVSNRMTALKDIINEASHKVVIFAPFRNSIELIITELTKLKITCDAKNGDVSMNKRSQIFKNFQETKDPQVLVVQPQSASHGVTLHAANVVVFWSPVVSVETYIQCCARMDRAGQRNPMTVVHLQGSPVESKIYKMLQGKIEDHVKLVDIYKEELGII